MLTAWVDLQTQAGQVEAGSLGGMADTQRVYVVAGAC